MHEGPNKGKRLTLCQTCSQALDEQYGIVRKTTIKLKMQPRGVFDI